MLTSKASEFDEAMLSGGNDAEAQGHWRPSQLKFALKASNAFLQENQEMVAEALQLEEYEAGRVIYKQGDIGDCFYLIHEGTVAVAKSPPAVERLGPKAFFGERALLKAEKRSATPSC